MEEIKVVHVSNLDVGFKVHYGNYLKYLKNQGYRIYAVSSPGEWLTEDTTIHDGIPAKIINFPPRISPFQDLITLFKLVKYFRKEQFDIVHTHTVKPGLLGRLAAKLSGVPIVIHTIHGYYSFEGMTPFQNYIFDTIEKIGAACSDLLLSQNREEVQTTINKKIAPPEKVHFLGNGINLERFYSGQVSPEKVDELRKDLGIEPNEAVIGFIGRLVEEKGIIELIEAAEILKNKGIKAKFLVIGRPQKTKSSTIDPTQMIKLKGLEDEILLLGYREDILELYAAMDLLAFPSHGREGVPRVVMESAAFGLPVVATSVRGVNEAIVDGVTGLLVPPRDSAALAEGIRIVLQDPNLALEFGKNSRAHAAENFDERQFFYRTDKEYRQLIKSKLGTDINPVMKPIPEI
jgi:glycosyltransferase involved in cell wall biosynthesis